ncbi:shugoshin 2 [Sphaerodactylus townsendi]|uniref:Uncharacterized protein n=1 Tax=Sphaerodactylus townsendi TaxID=933632 RepID=A0ACB8E9S4_9SAUR|nr:shugoshin 2 [Sphaerodactylus townsendi]
MSKQDPAETSSLSEIRERMKEKKNSALKTTKINASIAAKIRTKAINNSSIIKITLKQNNKALALAHSAAKREARELTKEKMLLQKEVKLGDFERAFLRQKLSAVVNLFVKMHQRHNKYMEELQQLMGSQLRALVKLSSPAESDSCLLLPDERLSTTEMTDSQADDNRPIRPAPKAMRIPFFQDDDKGENDKGDLASTRQSMLSLQLPVLAAGEPLKRAASPAVEKPSSSYLTEEPLASCERNGHPSGEMDGAALALDLNVTLGGNLSSIPKSSRSCSLSMLNKNDKLGQCSETTKSHSDLMVVPLGHVTQRRKRTTDFSDSFRECSLMELSDNRPLAGSAPPKEMERAEMSQVGELVTPKARNRSYKIKAGEAKVLKKMSMEMKGRGSSISKSRVDLDDCNEGAAPNTTQPKALGRKTMIVSESTEGSAQVDNPEKIQPLNTHGQNVGHNSQCFDKTVCVASPYHVEDLPFAENSNNIGNASQRSDKADACEKISVVDLAPWEGKNGVWEPKNKAQVVEFDPSSWRQTPDSISSLKNTPPAFPALLDDAFSDSECRKWFKTVPKVQRFSDIQNTILLKTKSSSLEKTSWKAMNQVTDLKRKSSKPKADRKAYSENNVIDRSLDSHHVAQAATGQKTPARSCALLKTSAVNNNNANQVSSGRQKTMQETHKESSPKAAPHLNENTILKDLTNSAQTLCHSTLLEEPGTRRGGRAKKSVNYQEPKLNRKLRRGDPIANSDIFNCPVYKTRKKKKTDSEAISKESSSDPVP